MENSVHPNQTPQDAASELGLHCLIRPVRPEILRYCTITPVEDYNSCSFIGLEESNPS